MTQTPSPGQDKKARAWMYDPTTHGGRRFDNQDLRHLQESGMSGNDILRAAAYSGSVQQRTSARLNSDDPEMARIFARDAEQALHQNLKDEHWEQSKYKTRQYEWGGTDGRGRPAPLQGNVRRNQAGLDFTPQYAENERTPTYPDYFSGQNAEKYNYGARSDGDGYQYLQGEKRNLQWSPRKTFHEEEKKQSEQKSDKPDRKTPAFNINDHMTPVAPGTDYQAPSWDRYPSIWKPSGSFGSQSSSGSSSTDGADSTTESVPGVDLGGYERFARRGSQRRRFAGDSIRSYQWQSEDAW